MKTEFLLRRKIAFFNLLKWFLASTFIGAVVGVFNSFFLKLLSMSINATNGIKYYYLALPLALYIVNYLAKKVYASESDFSTNDAIDKINSKKPLSLISTVKAFFLPIITIAAGGSAGKESPCADVGAGIASFVSKLISFNANERRKLMICGVSAGFAGVFGVPISGAMFGLEVLRVGTVFYEVMFPAFIAGITSYQVTHFMGVDYVYHTIHQLQPISLDGSILQIIAAGVFFGLVSLLFIEILNVCKIIFRFISYKSSMFIKCMIGGCIIILISLLVSPIYSGLGMEQVDAVLSGQLSGKFDFLFKMITTAITFAAGGIGGIITPIFYIGATAGSLFAQLTGLDSQTFAALGLVSVLAGVANTPLSASIMATELFGAQIGPSAAVACIVSFLLTGQRTVFSKQKFGFDKNLSDDMSDDGKPAAPQTVSELQKTLHNKNIFISSVRHLLPKPDFQEQEPKDIKNTQTVKEPQQNKEPLLQEEQKPKRGFKMFNLFGHLSPKHMADDVKEENPPTEPPSEK